jgi:predicted  nucleic acid-binding Zn-ribbon protein
MLQDLQNLIRLHELDVELGTRRKWIDELPAASAALDARLDERRTAVAAANDALNDNLTRRRTLEKDLAVVQGRLTKFKDQLMEVKTNKEYLAMQHEIAMAQEGVQKIEDQLLELMVQADELASRLGRAQADLNAENSQVATERGERERERTRIETEVQDLSSARAAIERDLSPELVALFNKVSKQRGGSAVAQARDGHCTACQLRLRPQVYNEIMRNGRIIQCESCSRILFYVPTAPTAPTGAPDNAARSAS